MKRLTHKNNEEQMKNKPIASQFLLLTLLSLTFIISSPNTGMAAASKAQPDQNEASSDVISDAKCEDSSFTPGSSFAEKIAICASAKENEMRKFSKQVNTYFDNAKKNAFDDEEKTGLQKEQNLFNTAQRDFFVFLQSQCEWTATREQHGSYEKADFYDCRYQYLKKVLAEIKQRYSGIEYLK